MRDFIFPFSSLVIPDISKRESILLSFRMDPR